MLKPTSRTVAEAALIDLIDRSDAHIARIEAKLAEPEAPTQE